MVFPNTSTIYLLCTANILYTHYTHSMQRTFITDYLYVQCIDYIIYSLYIAHTDSQLYFDKYKFCVQNKCALCTLYTVVCTYSIHIAIVLLASGPSPSSVGTPGSGNTSSR